MTGYVESLTDPSYKSQILVLTYPLIGNYGVPADTKDKLGLYKHFESDRIYASGLIASEYCDEHSHWNASRSLANWLVESNVPGIHGIDTRRLTKILREKGSMLAKVPKINHPPIKHPNFFFNLFYFFKIFTCPLEAPMFRDQKFFDPNKINLVDLVSTKVNPLNDLKLTQN